MSKIQRTIAFIIVALIANSHLNAQDDLFNWRSYTSQMSISDVTLGNDQKIYAASGGGLTIYDLNTEKFNLVNSLNGLWDNELTALYYDRSSGNIITGSATGALVIVYPNLSTEILLEIQKSNYSDKKINSFSVLGSELFISTGFGLVVYDLNKKIFTETILKFGSFTTNTSANKSLIYDNKIFLATNEGIAYASLSSQLADPKVWANLTDGGNTQINDLISVNGNLYCTSGNNLYQFDLSKMQKIATEQSPILNLTQKDNKAYYATEWVLTNILDKTNFPIQTPFPLQRVFFLESDNTSGNIFNSDFPILVFKSFGMEYMKGSTRKKIIPNSPITNYFKRLNVGLDGELLAATDRFTSRGCMIFDGKDWQNFYPELTPGILTNGIVSIMQAKNGKYYLGSWAVGAMELDLTGDSIVFQNYNDTNSPIGAFNPDGHFCIIGDIRQSKDETIWMVNYGENKPGNLLVAMDKNGSFYGFENCSKPLGRYYFALTIDGSNTKWVGSTQADGLYYFNENGTLGNPADDICGTILMSQYPNLPSNEQKALAIDKNDILWIGTPSGLGSIYNPSAVIYGQKPIVRTVKAVGNTNINDIYVDAVDNKWLATNEGVWILNSDGSEVLRYINITNSPLPSNQINSITGDENSGTIYIGTDKGLYSVSTMNVKAASEYEITCYPQPFVLSKHDDLLIDGLAANSEISITTISGELVKRISTFSRRVMWDGTDQFGNYVKTGVYLINAQSRTGGQSSVQKAAVVGK